MSTPGVVLEFGFGGGVRLTTQNPYPFLGVILTENSASKNWTRV